MFELIITPDDPEQPRIEMTATMRDVRMWERTTRGRALAQHLGENMRAEYVFELAHAACKRQQLDPGKLTLDEFVATHEVELEEPAAKRARQRAEALKTQIQDAPDVVVDEDEEESALGVDPTPPGVSPGQ